MQVRPLQSLLLPETHSAPIMRLGLVGKPLTVEAASDILFLKYSCIVTQSICKQNVRWPLEKKGMLKRNRTGNICMLSVLEVSCDHQGSTTGNASGLAKTLTCFFGMDALQRSVACYTDVHGSIGSGRRQSRARRDASDMVSTHNEYTWRCQIFYRLIRVLLWEPLKRVVSIFPVGGMIPGTH